LSEDSTATLSYPAVGTAAPDAAVTTALVYQRSLAEQNSSSWQKVIDEELLNWCVQGLPDLEEDLQPPTHDALAAAILVADKMRTVGAPPPSRVVPNGEGGIIFERFVYPQQIYQAFEIFKDLTTELRTYKDSKLVDPQ